MGVTFLQPRAGDADKVRLGAQILDGGRAAIEHTGAQAANGMMPVTARTLVVFALLAVISFLAQARTRNLRRSGMLVR